MPPADPIAELKKSLRSQMRVQLKALAESTPDSCRGGVTPECNSSGEQRIADYRESRISAGTDAARSLRKSELYANADLVLSYVALASEFDTNAINALVLADGKQLALPRIMDSAEDAYMDFFLVNPAVPLEKQLVKNRYGIWEPEQGCPIVSAPRKPAIMLVPGLAFSRDGKRLGRGKGYYDRYLSRFSETDVICVGVCFECQLLETVPVEAHDRRVEWVLTDNSKQSLVKLLF
jgi:5-formyltetrahydrofolate cyclo-ligase